jgi:hypothetical protein
VLRPREQVHTPIVKSCLQSTLCSWRLLLLLLQQQRLL